VTLGLGQQRLNSVIHFHSFHSYLLIVPSRGSLVNPQSGAIYSSVAGALLNSGDNPQSFASKVFREPDLPTLPGKVPSWTPIAPLIAWVERKHLSWTDRETGKALTVAEIAYLIKGKIKREGIAARNVFASVISNREQWIYQQLNDIEVSL